ncbi:uncharacterized protein AruCF_0546 [Achromobacter ruhlandii]|nr:uncharacterized protein AruCF_0546 [Achromobacter ruhlandii]
MDRAFDGFGQGRWLEMRGTGRREARSRATGRALFGGTATRSAL